MTRMGRILDREVMAYLAVVDELREQGREPTFKHADPIRSRARWREIARSRRLELRHFKALNAKA